MSDFLICWPFRYCILDEFEDLNKKLKEHFVQYVKWPGLCWLLILENDSLVSLKAKAKSEL